MSAFSNNVFANIANVKTNAERLPFIEPGEYVLEMEMFKVFKSVNPSTLGQDTVLLEFAVAEAAEGSTNSAGSRCAWSRRLTNNRVFQDVKTLTAAMLGCNPNEITPEVMGDIVETDGANLIEAGLNRLGVKATTSAVSPKTGLTYTNLSFYPVDADGKRIAFPTQK